MKPSQIVGKEPDESKIPYSEFKVDEETGKITECPNEEKPQVSYSSKDSYTAKFKTEQCENCPKKEKCAAKQEKKGYSVRISKKGYSNSKIRQARHTKEYTKITNKRSGVEGIPSVIRRKYHVDAMPVRGLLRSKMEFGFKIGAYNFNKLLKYLKKKGIFLTFIRFMRMRHTIIGKKMNEDNQYTEIVYLTF